MTKCQMTKECPNDEARREADLRDRSEPFRDHVDAMVPLAAPADSHPRPDAQHPLALLLERLPDDGRARRLGPASQPPGRIRDRPLRRKRLPTEPRDLLPRLLR